VKSLDKELKEAWQEMAELTKPRCDSCAIPRSCCSPEYCEMAIQEAKKWGETLTTTGHPKLPLMGETGCVAAPHLRILCTLHVCEGTFWRSTMAWKKKYMTLRERLNKLESMRRRSK
jgi:hypothetical protein